MGNKYLIKEAAKLVDVEPHVLRYWEEELDMRIKRNDMGHRYYDEQDIRILKKIKELTSLPKDLRKYSSAEKFRPMIMLL